MNKQRVQHQVIHCPDQCGKRTKTPAQDGWLELFDWSVINADDSRGPEAATLWFFRARCVWQYGERVLIADLGAQISGEANERIAAGAA